MNHFTQLRAVLPARSADLKRLEQAGCRTLSDFEALVIRHFVKTQNGNGLGFGWMHEPSRGPRLAQTTWHTLLGALEQVGFRWGDYWLA